MATHKVILPVTVESQRAVFVYQMDSYHYWERELNCSDFTFGQFGENFTVDGLADGEVCVGDRDGPNPGRCAVRHAAVTETERRTSRRPQRSCAVRLSTMFTAPGA